MGAEESGAAPVRARALAPPEETTRAGLPERVSDAERPRTPREGSRRSLDRVAETLGRLRAEPFLRGTRATCASPSGRGAGDGARRPVRAPLLRAVFPDFRGGNFVPPAGCEPLCFGPGRRTVSRPAFGWMRPRVRGGYFVSAPRLYQGGPEEARSGLRIKPGQKRKIPPLHQRRQLRTTAHPTTTTTKNRHRKPAHLPPQTRKTTRC